jgi:hypothetical protein
MSPEAQAEEHKVVVGIDAENADLINAAMDDLPVDSEDLGVGGLEEADVTIIGFDIQEGGEERMGDDGKPYTTTDSLVMHQRIDNAEDLGIEYDNTVQFISLPKLIQRRDGTTGRAKPTASSKYGALIQSFEALGIVSAAKSADPNYDGTVRLTWGRWSDLIGLQYHRESAEFAGFRAGQTYKCDIPTDILGMDNGIRTEAGLDAAMLV